MSDSGGGYDLPAWIPGLFGTVAFVSAALAVYGFMRNDSALYADGIGGILGTGLLFPIAWLLWSNRSNDQSELRESMRKLTEVMQRSSEQAVLSDDARRVLHRKRERELLRRAIEEDIAAEQWDAASVLTRELAERFGYREDAEGFRQRIDQARSATTERRLDDSLRELDAMIVRCQWDKARDEVERMGRVFPDSPRLAGLGEKVERARTRYKAELERRFLHAAEADRVDEALDLLKELDHYLTEAEGQQYEELARGVFGKAKENLAATFKLAVHDKDWTQAARLGERIIREFPNSGMAAEVREIIDTVRQRAATMATVPATPQGT